MSEAVAGGEDDHVHIVSHRIAQHRSVAVDVLHSSRAERAHLGSQLHSTRLHRPLELVVLDRQLVQHRVRRPLQAQLISLPGQQQLDAAQQVGGEEEEDRGQPEGRRVRSGRSLRPVGPVGCL